MPKAVSQFALQISGLWSSWSRFLLVQCRIAAALVVARLSSPRAQQGRISPRKEIEMAAGRSQWALSASQAER